MIRAILELLSQSVAAYRRKRDQAKLERKIDALERQYREIKKRYADAQITIQEYQDELDELVAEYQTLSHKYGDMLYAESIRRIRDDKRDLPDNPY